MENTLLIKTMTTFLRYPVKRSIVNGTMLENMTINHHRIGGKIKIEGKHRFQNGEEIYQKFVQTFSWKQHFSIFYDDKSYFFVDDNNQILYIGTIDGSDIDLTLTMDTNHENISFIHLFLCMATFDKKQLKRFLKKNPAVDQFVHQLIQDSWMTMLTSGAFLAAGILATLIYIYRN